MDVPDIPAAVGFLAANARVLDRRRFERLFQDGPAEAVRDAVAAYRNPDGGFGQGLEPDGRTPSSQPAAIMLALRTLNEADAWDDDLVSGALSWLERNEPDDGGVAFVAPGVDDGPHAPWWQIMPGLPATLLTTGSIAGVLHGRGVEHPWLDRAAAWMWSQVESELGDDVDAYALFGVLAFLQTAPDRTRADAAYAIAERRLLQGGVVELDPEAEGETHSPLDFAPRLDSLARRAFAPDVIDAHLDKLATSQRDDGGWMFNWPSWSPAAEMDWRGSITVDALATLRANRWI